MYSKSGNFSNTYCYSGNVIKLARVKTDESVPWIHHVLDVGGFVVRFWTGAGFLYLLQNACTCPEAHSATYRMGNISSSYEVNRRRGEAEHSPPPNVKVKKKNLIFISTLTCEILQVFKRDNSHIHFGNRKVNPRVSQTAVSTIYYLNFTGSSCKHMDIYDSLVPPDTTNIITTANNFVATKRQKKLYI
jgi:hypothetical protein